MYCDLHASIGNSARVIKIRLGDMRCKDDRLLFVSKGFNLVLFCGGASANRWQGELCQSARLALRHARTTILGVGAEVLHNIAWSDSSGAPIKNSSKIVDKLRLKAFFDFEQSLSAPHKMGARWS